MTRSAVLAMVLILLMLAALAGCGDSGAGMFGIRADDDFATAKARLEEQGFRLESRETEPFIFTAQDFQDYYDFHGQTRLLHELQEAFASLLKRLESYELFESLYINSYIFHYSGKDSDQAQSGGEVGVGFSALTGKPLYVYYYADDISALLAEYQERLGGSEQVFSAPAQGEGVTHHYFEGHGVLVILEQFAGNVSGGGICCFTENVAEFYRDMHRELDKRGE